MIPASIPVAIVETVVRKGSLMHEVCEPPDKLVFRGRDLPGMAGLLVVVTRFRPSHIKVVTVYIER